jgi:hypothetical protein
MLYAPITHRIEKIIMGSIQISLLYVITTTKTLLTHKSNGCKETAISTNKEKIKETGIDAKIF